MAITTGIIGGTGLYKVEGIEIIDQKKVETPFGAPSAPLTIGKLGDREVIFLPRHGVHHEIMPSNINFRANLWALKEAGARQIISISATGSLQQEIAPGDFALVDQYFDHTRGRRVSSYFDNGMVGHISTAEPACARLSASIYKVAQSIGQPLHQKKTYACVEGPRLGTRAESFFLKNAVKADLVGMTNVPEAFLANEAGLCYVTIGIATDYDCWLDDPDAHVSLAAVIAQYGKSLSKVTDLVKAFLAEDHSPRDCQCHARSAHAVMTPAEFVSPQQKKILELLSAP